MNSLQKKNPLVIILVEPSGEINLGSIARLCANFDVDELRLVKPSCNPNNLESRKMAIKGKIFLEKSKQYLSLLDAISDCDKVIATCGRIDHGEIPLEPPEKAFSWLMEDYSSNPIAIVFGREDRGLSNAELQLANKVITLNSDSSYPSLNISHAVGIILHELSKFNKPQNNSLNIASHIPASPKVLNDFLIDAEELLLDVKFLLKHTAKARMQKVRLLLNRAEIRSEEVSLLRGMLRQIRWWMNTTKS